MRFTLELLSHEAKLDIQQLTYFISEVNERAAVKFEN